MFKEVIVFIYYTALLNAVERSVHLHGPSRLPAVNYFFLQGKTFGAFLIMTRLNSFLKL